MCSGAAERAMRPLLNTQVKFEQENIANLIKMARDYGRRIGLTGAF